jgi:hypothetical protein
MTSNLSLGNFKLGLALICLLLTIVLISFFKYEYISVSIFILITFLLFKPSGILHPNIVLTGFYFLYLILPSFLQLILTLNGYNYILPWGQVVFWDSFEKFTFFQMLSTFVILFFSFHIFSGNEKQSDDFINYDIADNKLVLISVVLTIFLFYYLNVTGGISEYLNSYGQTYLTMREGHGLASTIIMYLGNLVVFLFGLKYFKTKHIKYLILGFAFILSISFLQGIKSRFIFLLMVFFVPNLLQIKLNLKKLFLFVLGFMVLLYLGTHFRTEGFYSTYEAFLEYMIDYFNSFQLHDDIVRVKNMNFLSTQWQIFVKPLQILGLVSDQVDFDLNVMLTKEFFPDQWDNSHATQQWPLDTELYLNYYGPYLSWIILIPYSFLVSFIYKKALRGHIGFILIFLMEFLRIFSTLRGTIIPYDFTLIIVSYYFIYFSSVVLLKRKIAHNYI